MAKYQHFKELPVWQEAARLYNKVLDLLADNRMPLTGSFRNQLDRAAFSVSNNIAEGFERQTTSELLNFIGIARGSVGETCSMILVVKNRPNLRQWLPALNEIVLLAESCGKQLTAWTGSLENSDVQGKRHMTSFMRQQREAERKAREFRTNFLRNLKPTHPLYQTPEAKTARGEVLDK